MKRINKRNVVWRYSFAVILIIAGLIFSSFSLGGEFFGFSSVGLWLIYVGFFMLAVITLGLLFNKNRIVDERMNFIALKASRMTFVFVILSAFIIMIVDGINPISLSYKYFMSYFISGIVFVYFVIYKILERFN